MITYFHPKRIQINASTRGSRRKPMWNSISEYELKPPMHREGPIQVETGFQTGQREPLNKTSACMLSKYDGDSPADA